MKCQNCKYWVRPSIAAMPALPGFGRCIRVLSERETGWLDDEGAWTVEESERLAALHDDAGAAHLTTSPRHYCAMFKRARRWWGFGGNG
jgi:hypothetical protein